MRWRHQLNGLIVAAILVLPAFVLAGFAQATLNPVAWSARVEPAQVKSGGTAKMLLSIKLDPGWHVYALTQPPPPKSLRISFDEGGMFALAGEPQQPKPKVEFDPNFQIETQFFEGAATFTVPVKLRQMPDQAQRRSLPRFASGLRFGALSPAQNAASRG